LKNLKKSMFSSVNDLLIGCIYYFIKVIGTLKISVYLFAFHGNFIDFASPFVPLPLY